MILNIDPISLVANLNKVTTCCVINFDKTYWQVSLSTRKITCSLIHSITCDDMSYYAHTHIYTYVYKYIYLTWIKMYGITQLCVIHVMTCPSIYTHTHRKREMYIYIYIYTNTHTEKHTHVYIHTHIQTSTHMYINSTQIDIRM